MTQFNVFWKKCKCKTIICQENKKTAKPVNRFHYRLFSDCFNDAALDR